MKEFRLVRIDDRLLHGQVTLGWRQELDPEIFWIVDTEVAGDQFASSLFESALPEGTKLRVLATDEFMKSFDSAEDLSRTVLLVRGLATLRSLCEGGFNPKEVNLGGIHPRPGAVRHSDYLFLTPDDSENVRWLLDQGITLYAQDLPTSPRLAMTTLLSEGGAVT